MRIPAGLYCRNLPAFAPLLRKVAEQLGSLRDVLFVADVLDYMRTIIIGGGVAGATTALSMLGSTRSPVCPRWTMWRPGCST